ncbi:hypothetical protein J6Z19_04065 [bacterium]|nr:hypothetical protein [bacterium]
MKRFWVFAILLFTIFTLFAEDENSLDENACDYARQAKNIEVWQKYLEKFPEGKCAFEAETEIERLKNENQAPEKPAETPAEEEKYEKEPTYIVLTQEPVVYYRPYKTAGISLLVVGLAADVAGGITYYTGRFKDDSKMMLGGLITSIVGVPLWITGAVLLGIRRPLPDQKVELNSFSVAPTKGGAYASLGFHF